jgi:hypothetical protein
MRTKDESQLSFLYYENPLLTKFIPKTGPSSGNSTVVIYGAGFIGQNETTETTDIWVRFNSTDTGSLYGTSKAYDVGINQISIQTPPGDVDSRAVLSISKNNVDFVVIRGVGKTELDDYFTYYEAPHVIRLDPSYGPVKMADRDVTI